MRHFSNVIIDIHSDLCVRMSHDILHNLWIDIVLTQSGTSCIHPMAEYSCASIDKAALRSLACTLHQELKEKGIFVGIVTIMGNVVPETHYAPEKIAEVYWKMYQERKVWEYIYQ